MSALQPSGEELLVSPALGAGPFSEALDRGRKRGRFERPGEEGQLRGDVAPAGGGLGRRRIRPWWEVRLPEPAGLGTGPHFRKLMTGAEMLGLLGGGDPEPKALPPAEPLLPDPRLVLAIAYWVRAGLIAHAQTIAGLTKGIDDPELHVERVKEQRASQVSEAQQRRWRRRRR
jgi:hypothetical protein